jgi:organic hydroperoxide reductase OsmC/OhrA
MEEEECMRHEYEADLVWTGNQGEGTATYSGYSREHRVRVAGKPELVLSADRLFRGDPGQHNPEDLLIAAIAGCHMLAYLALCARQGVNVIAYEDRAAGIMVTDRDGGGKFESVVLKPVVTIAADSDEQLALTLHHTAHQQCFIANSCSVPIGHEPTIRSEAVA